MLTENIILRTRTTYKDLIFYICIDADQKKKKKYLYRLSSIHWIMKCHLDLNEIGFFFLFSFTHIVKLDSDFEAMLRDYSKRSFSDEIWIGFPTYKRIFLGWVLRKRNSQTNQWQVK